MSPDPSILTISDSMSPTELGAAIHKHLGKNQGCEVRLESLGTEKAVTIKVYQDQFKPDSTLIDTTPRPHVNVGTIGRRNPVLSTALLSIAAMGMGLGGGFPGFGEPSASDVRHDPERVKTPGDLERIEAARAKQARKAAKRAAAGK